jgi:mannose-6-phosphate isomerase
VPPTGTLTLVSGPHFHLVRATDSWPALDHGDKPVTIVPLSAGCTIAGEQLAFGECARVADPTSVTLAPGASALACWPA